jgi:antitoxin HicB
MCRCEGGGVEVPLVVTPEPNGGYKVTSPVLPELIAHGKTVEDALSDAQVHLCAVLDLYEEQGRPLPAEFL